MAEALILVLLQKIATTLGGAALNGISSGFGKEASLLLEVENSMKEIESEFDVMQAFISEVEPYCTNNLIFQSWLKHIRKVAFEVEDIIDEYAFLLGKLDGTECFLKTTFRKSVKIKSWHNIASQLQQVKCRLKNMTEMRERYGINFLDENQTSSSHNNIGRHMYPSDSSYLNDDDSAIVGQEVHMQKLADWLKDESAERTIISICGMGGSGKTTLARSICEKQDVRMNFDCHACISVSRNYQEDLMSIMEQLKIKPDKCGTNDTMKDTIFKHLEKKRYLIVLDDMWDRDSWSYFNDAFSKKSCGSKVIITTRNEAVASLAELENTISLGVLSSEESWHLFCKKAFSKLNGAKCSGGLINRAEEILEKCQGLPLAIVAIGSLLSYMGAEEKQWALFSDQLNWQLTNNAELSKVSNILNSSLNGLPTHLKNCFMYCGLFPEDHLIRRKWIIRMWIAEGFVEGRGTETTLEEVAEDYLKELTQRSLVQVVERNEFGRPRRFKLHNLVREITWTVSKRQRFSLICDNPDVTSLGDAVRRVSVHTGGQCFQPGAAWRQLRTFLLFDNSASITWIRTASSNLRLLRVISLRNSLLKDFPSAILGLFNLYYLDLSRSENLKKIPKSVARLRNLQTLHLRRTSVSKLPREITLLTSLRHLSVSSDLYGTSIEGDISRLKYLHTLKEVKASKYVVRNLGYLTQLRSLSITSVLASDSTHLWSSIGKLKFLARLAVASRYVYEGEVFDLKKFRASEYLEKFYLDAKLVDGKVFPVSECFKNLKLLVMRYSGLQEDPLSSLYKMENLVYLELNDAYDGEKLVFCSEWFRKLKYLYLGNMRNLNSIKIIEGTMENLTDLNLIKLDNLTAVPEGLAHLKMLQRLFAKRMPNDFTKGLVEHRKGLLKHVASIESV